MVNSIKIIKGWKLVFSRVYLKPYKCINWIHHTNSLSDLFFYIKIFKTSFWVQNTTLNLSVFCEIHKCYFVVKYWYKMLVLKLSDNKSILWWVTDCVCIVPYIHLIYLYQCWGTRAFLDGARKKMYGEPVKKSLKTENTF